MSTNDPLVIVYDCGTQSTRAFIFNKQGEILAQSKVNTPPTFSNRIGFVERNTEEYWNALVRASLLLREECGSLWTQVTAMAVTTIRGTYAFLDSDNKPVRPSITWMDQRLASHKQKFTKVRHILYKLSGMYDIALKQRRMAPSTWIKENEPEIWKKINKVCIISAYINYKLTGRLCDSTASQASRLPYDYKNHRWMTNNYLNYDILNCDIDKMVELVEPMTVTGYITHETALATGLPEGLQVITTGSDKACETLGVGCVTDDVASISFGTTSTIQYVTDKYIEPQSHMPSYNAVFPSAKPKQYYYNPEIQIFRGYWMVSWFKEQFAEKDAEVAREMNIKTEEYLDMMLSKVPAGSDGLIVQPYWAPGLKNPEAKGSMIGYNDYHTKAHVYKAIIEGIGYALYDGSVKLARRTGNKIVKIMASGGGSQSEAVCQITADIFGLPISRVQTYETSGLGAAIVAFGALGEFTSIENAVSAMVHTRDVFYPKRENHELYMDIYKRVYSKIYKQLQSLYHELYTIINE